MKKVVFAAAVVAFAVVGLANSAKTTTTKTVQSGVSRIEAQIEAATK